VTGTRDLFLRNTVRVHARLRQAGVVADLLVYEGVSHADYVHVFDAPEARHLALELDGLLTQHLRRAARMPVAVPRMEATRIV